MNTTNTIFPNISNSNKKYYDSMKDCCSKTSSGISKPASATDKQDSTSFILQDSRSRDEHNEIHDSQHHRKVNSKDSESSLTQTNCHRSASHDSLDDNIKHNAENIPAPKEWPSCTETVKGLFTSLIPSMKEESSKAFRWEPKPALIATSLLNIYNPCLIFGITLLYTLAGNARVVEASGETNSPPPDTEEMTNTIRKNIKPNTIRKNITNNSASSLSKGAPNNKIEIGNIKDLENIGVDENFPIDGNYELTTDLDGSSFTKSIDIFKGDLNGRSHTISNLKFNLITVIAHGKVRNLIINNANITETKDCLASIACIALEGSIISNVQIIDSNIHGPIANTDNPAGAIVSILASSSRIENSIIKNCTITTEKESSWIGGLTGTMQGTSKSYNNTVDRCSFITRAKNSDSGCLIGAMLGDSLSANDKVFNCSSTTSSKNSHAGGAVGRGRSNLKIKNVTVSESRAEANGPISSSGVLLGFQEYLGQQASISESTAINSIAIATQEGSHAGIWVGQPSKKLQLYNNTAINCTAEAPAPVETTVTETANLTTTEPAMVVDGASYLPLGLLLTGATVTSIGAACFAYSLYNGFQEGKRGRSLAMHPFTSFGKLLTNSYRQCVPGFSLVSTTSADEEMTLTDNIEMTPL